MRFSLVGAASGLAESFAGDLILFVCPLGDLLRVRAGDLRLRNDFSDFTRGGIRNANRRNGKERPGSRQKPGGKRELLHERTGSSLVLRLWIMSPLMRLRMDWPTLSPRSAFGFTWGYVISSALRTSRVLHKRNAALMEPKIDHWSMFIGQWSMFCSRLTAHRLLPTAYAEVQSFLRRPV